MRWIPSVIKSFQKNNIHYENVCNNSFLGMLCNVHGRNRKFKYLLVIKVADVNKCLIWSKGTPREKVLGEWQIADENDILVERET